jgi:hypothetical protein
MRDKVFEQDFGKLNFGSLNFSLFFLQIWSHSRRRTLDALISLRCFGFFLILGLLNTGTLCFNVIIDKEKELREP